MIDSSIDISKSIAKGSFSEKTSLFEQNILESELLWLGVMTAHNIVHFAQSFFSVQMNGVGRSNSSARNFFYWIDPLTHRSLN